MPKKLEVKVKSVEGLYEAELSDGTKFKAPNKEDVKTLAAWTEARPTWNAEKQLYEGFQYGEPVSAPTLAGLRSKVALMPDEDTYKILGNMPEYPTLFAPSKTQEFDKTLEGMMSCYEDSNRAKSVAKAAGKNFVFELMIPKGVIKKIDKSSGVFQIQISEVPNAAVKRALQVEAMKQ